MTTAASRHPVVRTIHGASSWRIANDVVQAWLTREGGHLGPVTFKTPVGEIQPFAVAPWLPREIAKDAPEVLRNLRGDFFCLPFGANSPAPRGEQHSLHGATSSARWSLLSYTRSRNTAELVAGMRLTPRQGTITKRIRLAPGQTVLYCSHDIKGMAGPMCLGHHAMLRFPDQEGAGRIACSGIRFGQVGSAHTENPAQGGYSSLRPGAVFRDLRRVPCAAGGYADLTRFPARAGFDDLVLLVSGASGPLGWTAVTYPREKYLWFALKNPKQLVSTLLWHSNGGRHYPPWNGRHRPVLGLEDITAFFDLGLAASSRVNSLSRRGVPTTLTLRQDRVLRIPYVMGVARIPNGFDTVDRVRFKADHIVFESKAGPAVRQSVDLTFLNDTERVNP
jgi:hypothetical protein